jgi:hypothetical protein
MLEPVMNRNIYPLLRFLPAVFLAPLLLLPCAGQTAYSSATNANRLVYLDDSDPFCVHRHFPRLTTPQWVGEEGVEAVVTLAIDDMRDAQRYENYLRPILERLKQIDGRAPVSIMALNSSWCGSFREARHMTWKARN